MRRLGTALILTLAVISGIPMFDWRRATRQEVSNLQVVAPRISSPNVSTPTTSVFPALVAVLFARPLFEPSRRPIAAAIAEGGTAEQLPRLSGIVTTIGARRVIFAASAGGKAVTAMEGTRIGAYLIEAIGAEEVTILGPDGIHTIKPTFDKDRAAITAGAPLSISRRPMSLSPPKLLEAPATAPYGGYLLIPPGLTGRSQPSR